MVVVWERFGQRGNVRKKRDEEAEEADAKDDGIDDNRGDRNGRLRTKRRLKAPSTAKNTAAAAATTTTTSNVTASSSSRHWAIVVGSSTWDLLEPAESYTKAGHIQAMRQFLTFLQDEFAAERRHVYNMTIIWKSPTAMHVHRATATQLPKNSSNNHDDAAIATTASGGGSNTTGILPGILAAPATTTNSTPIVTPPLVWNTDLEERIKYMSQSRTYQLYQQQKHLIATEFPNTVKWMEWYWPSAVAADWTYLGDGRHYIPEWNQQMMLQWMT